MFCFAALGRCRPMLSGSFVTTTVPAIIRFLVAKAGTCNRSQHTRPFNQAACGKTHPEIGSHSSSRKDACSMPTTAILLEARQLHLVSKRLALMADKYPLVSEALLSVSGSICQTAILLEVWMAM